MGPASGDPVGREPDGGGEGRRAFLGLGSNHGDPLARLSSAVRALAAEGERIAAVSRAVESPYEDRSGRPVPGAAAVWNAVVEVRTRRTPEQMLELALRVEAAEGRRREDPLRRTLDVDLLSLGPPRAAPDPVLPHPRAFDRAFVLDPWEELDPLFVVPGTGRMVVGHSAALRARRPEAFARLGPRRHLAVPADPREVVVLEGADALAVWRSAQAGSVGVVPTMGALHAGHEALVRRARAECDTVVATVFVNPLQFGPGEDLARYPRTFEADLALLARAGADAVYAPHPADLYPEGFATYLVPEGPALGFEGAVRPGHFRGVATVVYLLWVRTRPTRAYFGRKDAQQLAVLRRMVRDLELPGEVVPCATVREEDGLALSSRNRYLSEGERLLALALPRALEAVARAAAAGADAEAAKEEGRARLAEAALAADYLDVVDPDTLRPVGLSEAPALAVATVKVGTPRLLDNRFVARGTPRPASGEAR